MAWKSVLKQVGHIGWTLCVLHCLGEHVADIVVCEGPSMEPTLTSRDILLTTRMLNGPLKRGDIIVCRLPSSPREFICKRIRALPGELVHFDFRTETVPHGHIWLEGDNKHNSNDSRNYGPVPIGLVRSKAIFRIYPFKKATVFRTGN